MAAVLGVKEEISAKFLRCCASAQIVVRRRSCMAFHLTTELLPNLPRMSWWARVNRDTGHTHVCHGSAVETGSNFVVEGVWDGPFAEGRCHEAEHFFGSGIYVDENRVWLVPSHALVDRIIYALRGDELVASNSLALLLGCTGARLDPTCDYHKLSRTILEGLNAYEPRYPVVHPEIEAFCQLYYEPVAFSRMAIEKVTARPPRRFASYGEYVGLLRESLSRIHANCTSSQRRTPLCAFTMTSAGYDSTAVTALVRDFGVGESFTARRSWYNFLPLVNPRIVIDDGTPVIRRLGLSPIYFRRLQEKDELFFYAPTTEGSQISFHSMAKHIEQVCGGAVLFTGFHGDKVWDLHTSGRYLSDQIIRGDVSGLDLAEIRLKAGFVNVAIPFMFARSIRDLITIAGSPEMKPWRLGNDYDRPIPRRIAEESGVPRSAFGRKKRALVTRPPYPFEPGLRRAFFAHIRQRFGWSATTIYFRRWVNRIKALRPMIGLATSPGAPGWGTFWKEVDLHYELHFWALETLSRQLGSLFSHAQKLHPGTAGRPDHDSTSTP